MSFGSTGFRDHKRVKDYINRKKKGDWFHAKIKDSQTMNI